MDEQAIWDKHSGKYDETVAAEQAERKRIANDYREIVLKALSKAPKLQEPAVIARGTSLKELGELTGWSQDSNDYKALMDSIEAGAYDGKPIARASRLANIPESATVRAREAIRFTNMLWESEASEDREVIIALKGRSFASPVNVGAWGTGEYEVFTNPLSSYRIIGGRRVRDELFIFELEEHE